MEVLEFLQKSMKVRLHLLLAAICHTVLIRISYVQISSSASCVAHCNELLIGGIRKMRQSIGTLLCAQLLAFFDAS